MPARDIERRLRQVERESRRARLRSTAVGAEAEAIASSTELVQVDFIALEPVESTFPLVAATTVVAAGVQVVRVVNRTDSAAQHYEAVWCDWEPVSDGIRLKYVTGLAPGYAYSLYLEVRGA